MRGRAVLRRVAWGLATVGVVLVLNFFLFRVLPGDPARAGLHDPRLTPEAQEAIRTRFGLDRPVINGLWSLNPLRPGPWAVNPLRTQFFVYLGNLLRGELGISYHTNQPVADVLRERLWNTVLLVVSGQGMALALGVALGILAAWRARTAVDYAALTTSLVAWSLPTFWLGIVLLLWGSRHLGLPIAGMATPGLLDPGAGERWVDLGRHLVLPALTQAVVYMGEYFLVVRSTAVEVLTQDYILSARAKGLGTLQVLRDHALRNASLPLVTLVALNLGLTVAGAIQVEMVFSWPGLGQAIYEAVVRRDYPVLQGAFLLLAVSVVVANTLADLVYSYLDPRVRVQ
ncbi:MAG: ABC transporter permease [Candidatus Latescibacterota bacterium]